MDEVTTGQLQRLSRDPKKEQGEQQHPRGSEEVVTKLVLEGEGKHLAVRTLPSESRLLLKAPDAVLDNEEMLNY